jgi:hypothetical protein
MLAQDLVVPQLSQEQKEEVLFQHVMAYATTGIAFAKSKGVSPEDYGRFIGKSFSSFWDQNAGYKMFAGQLMYILSGLYPDNQMEILEQNDRMIRFRMKNVDLSFQNGPMFGVAYQEFLDCSFGIISELAAYMGVDFSHRMEGEWYEVTFRDQ